MTRRFSGGVELHSVAWANMTARLLAARVVEVARRSPNDSARGLRGPVLARGARILARKRASETVFPGGSFETADFFYREWGLARYYNAILGSVAETVRTQAAGKPLRF